MNKAKAVGEHLCRAGLCSLRRHFKITCSHLDLSSKNPDRQIRYRSNTSDLQQTAFLGFQDLRDAVRLRPGFGVSANGAWQARAQEQFGHPYAFVLVSDCLSLSKCQPMEWLRLEFRALAQPWAGSHQLRDVGDAPELGPGISADGLSLEVLNVQHGALHGEVGEASAGPVVGQAA